MSTPSSPPQGTPQGTSSPSSQQFWTWLRQLGITRSSERWIGGVAGGLAARWGLDPLVVRGLFAASMLLGGVGFLAYGVAWALLPEPDGRIHAERALQGHGDSALVGIVLLVIAGFDPASWLSVPWASGGVWDGLKTVGWIAVAVLVVYYVRQHKGSRRAGSGGPGASGAAVPGSSAPGAASGASAQDPASPQPLWGSAATASTAPAPTAQDLSSPYPQDAPTSESSSAAAPGAPGSAPAGDPQHRWDLPPLEPLPPLPPLPPIAEQTGASGRPAGASTTTVKAPRPKPPIVRGPGRAMISVVLALTILTVAGMLLANRSDVLVDGAWPLAVGILVTVVGVAIVVTGLRGRRSGVLTLFALIGIFTVPSAMSAAHTWDWSWDRTQLVGEVDVAPTSRTEAAEGYSVGAGNARVDLTGLPLTDETLVVPVSVDAGEIVVVVPAGADVQADVDIFAGEVTWEVDGQDETVSGRLPDPLTYSTQRVDDGAAPQLVLDLTVGAGNVTITEATS